MQKLILTSLLLVSLGALGYSVSPAVPADDGTVDAGANTIPTTYDTSAGSQVYSNLGGATAFDIYNNTLVDIAVRVKGTTCDSASGDNYTIPAGLALGKSNIAINKVICIRSKGAAISAGTVVIAAN